MYVCVCGGGGRSVIHFHIQKSMIFTIIAKTDFSMVRTTIIPIGSVHIVQLLEPILPYVATEMDTIFTSMINFQDVLKQKNAVSRALWSDEGVYAIAKEIQLFKPDHIGNIFLGMRPFHIGEVFIACLGTFLGCIDIDLALIVTEIFGKLENSVMTAIVYCKGMKAMSLVAEVMIFLMFEQFKADQDSTSCELDQQIEK